MYIEDLQYNVHVHNLSMCQTNTSSMCPGQGCCKALMRLFLRFHKDCRLSCGTDGAFKVKGSLFGQLTIHWTLGCCQGEHITL